MSARVEDLLAGLSPDAAGTGQAVEHRPVGMSCLLYAPSGVVLRYPRRSVVVLTGLPGAGKSTMLRRVRRSGFRVLDPYDATGRLPQRLRVRAHRMLRVPIHLLHWVSAVSAVLGDGRGVLVHAHGARLALPAVVLWCARLRRRPAHMLVIDALPNEALAGQAIRQRTVSPRRFTSHLRQQKLLDAGLRTGRGPARGWGSVCAARRDAAGW